MMNRITTKQKCLSSLCFPPNTTSLSSSFSFRANKSKIKTTATKSYSPPSLTSPPPLILRFPFLSQFFLRIETLPCIKNKQTNKTQTYQFSNLANIYIYIYSRHCNFFFPLLVSSIFSSTKAVKCISFYASDITPKKRSRKETTITYP